MTDENRDGEREAGEQDLQRIGETGLQSFAFDARAGFEPGLLPRVQRPDRGQGEDLPEADLVHRLEGRHQHHVKRHAEERGAHGQERQHRDGSTRNEPLPPPVGNRDQPGTHRAPDSFLRTCMTVSTTRGRKMRKVMSSIMTAAAEA